MKPIKIPQAFLVQIFAQAETEYPQECCGMILGPKNQPEKLTRFRPCKNAQNAMHAAFPDVFSRDGRTAYFILPEELLRIQKESRRRKEQIRVIYHSHIDAAAYFSEEDKRIALPEGEPAYPGMVYLVVSVVQGKAKSYNLFGWSEASRDFIPIPLIAS